MNTLSELKKVIFFFSDMSITKNTFIFNLFVGIPKQSLIFDPRVLYKKMSKTDIKNISLNYYFWASVTLVYIIGHLNNTSASTKITLCSPWNKRILYYTVGFGRSSRLIFIRNSRAKRKHRITFDIQNDSF